MPFDINAAQSAGYTPQEISGFLAQQNPNFDYAGAKSAGYSDDEISSHLSKPLIQSIPKDDYLSRVSEDISNAGKETANIIKDIPDSNPAASGIKLLGQGANIATAPIAEGLKSAYTSLPDSVTQPINSVAGAVAQPIMNAPHALASKINETDIGQRIGDYLMNSPKLAENAKGLSDTAKAAAMIATTLPAGKLATSVLEAPASKIGEAIKNLETKSQTAPNILGDVTSGKAPPSAPVGASDVRALANKAYVNAEAQGGVLTPKVTDNFIDKASEVLPQTEAGKLVLGETSTTKLVDRLQDLRGKPLSLQSAQEIDSSLSEAIMNNVDPLTGKVNSEGNKLSKIQQHLRDSIENAGESDIAGGKNGFDSWKEGKNLWATSARMSDVERIIEKASLTDNPVPALKTGFKNLYTNPTRMRGFSKEEAEAIKKAATTGIVTGALRIAGSRLIPIIAGSTGGGIAGAAAGYGVSEASRALANHLQMGKGNKVLSKLSSRPTVQEALAKALKDGQ